MSTPTTNNQNNRNELNQKALEVLERQKQRIAEAANNPEPSMGVPAPDPAYSAPVQHRMQPVRMTEAEQEAAYGAPPTEEEMANRGYATTDAQPTYDVDESMLDGVQASAPAAPQLAPQPVDQKFIDDPNQPRPQPVYATVTPSDSRVTEPLGNTFRSSQQQQQPLQQPTTSVTRHNPFPDPNKNPETYTGAVTAASISDDEVIITKSVTDAMSRMPKDAQDEFLAGLKPEIEQYRKDLIVKEGMTPEEANAAANSRAKAKAAEADDLFAKEHPDAVVIKIDKSQATAVEEILDEDTKAKMVKARAIKLVMMDSAELETLRFKPKSGDEHKRVNMNNVRAIAGSLSNYSVPLISAGDYATFRGAQSFELTSCTRYEDDSYMDWIDKKSNLIYRHFMKSTLNSRVGANGEDMSYEDFLNWFHFDDIDMAEYAVITASSMEEVETTYQCPNEQCRRVYPITYNNKALLDLSEIPDRLKQRVRDIDAARGIPSKMARVHEDAESVTRFRSPFTHNVYEMFSPTIAEVRDRLNRTADIVELSDLGVVAFFIYMKAIYIYDPEADAYEEPIVIGDDPAVGMDVVRTLHQIDVDLILKYIDENKYSPEFKIKTECPFCKRKAVDPLGIDALVFLHARATLVEIQ